MGTVAMASAGENLNASQVLLSSLNVVARMRTPNSLLYSFFFSY